MNYLSENLRNKLNNRESSGNTRSLNTNKYKIDFYSNDYLGLSRNKKLSLETLKQIDNYLLGNGATGSRLISGESQLNKDLERYLSEFYKTESTLVFNSGYNANLGLLSTVPQRKDVVLIDEFSHASIKDGLRLSMAKYYSFKHNDIEALRLKLKKFKTAETIYVVVEALYSMDGDIAPLKEIIALKKEFNFCLIVDEAHSVGIHGEYGEGLVASLNLEEDCFARIVTFGKAIGGHGGAILGSKELKKILINFCRPFIYTTGPSPHQLAYLLVAHKYLKQSNKELKELKSKINYFNTKIKRIDESPIKLFEFPSIEILKLVENQLNLKEIGAKAIYPPTVASGTERLRLCLHSYNSEYEIDLLLSVILKNMKKKRNKC